MLRWVGAAIVGVSLVFVAPLPAHAETVRHAEWYLDALQVPAAHKITRGNGVVVAVIDSAGVDVTHRDLAGQVLPGTGIGTGAGERGWSSTADASHATAMAGIIAAKGGGENNALGVAPEARILPVALAANERNWKPEDFANAIRWAVDHGADVINMSITRDTDPYPAELDAFTYAFSKNVIIVAAAGNRAQDVRIGSPANIPGVLAVSGTDRQANFWSGSMAGPEVGIAAPATQIVAPVPKADYASTYGSGTGTSDATAIVSGVVALVRARYPTLSAANVINRLLKTAKDHGPTGRDPQYGFGTVRPVPALTAEVEAVRDNPLGGPPHAVETNRSTGAGPPDGGIKWSLIAMVGGIAATVLLLVVALIVVLARRSRKSRATRTAQPGQPWAGQPGASGWPNQPPGSGWPAQPPPGQGQPPGQGWSGPPGAWPAQPPPGSGPNPPGAPPGQSAGPIR